MLTSKRNQKSAEMAALLDEYEDKMNGLRRGFTPGEHVSGTVVSVCIPGVSVCIDDASTAMNCVYSGTTSRSPSDTDLSIISIVTVSPS